MDTEAIPPEPTGAGTAERAAARAILLQRQNLRQIQQSVPTMRARLGAQGYAGGVAAEFPGLPDPLTLTPTEFLGGICRDTPALADLLTDPAALAELKRMADGPEGAESACGTK